MKMKSLLLAAAAFVALGASAQTLTTPDIEITSKDQIGQLIEMPLTLTLPEGGNFTNCQINITYPEAFEPAVDEYGTYQYGGADIVTTGRQNTPTVVWSDNANNPALWPDHIYIGSNANKVENYGGEILVINVKAKEGAANGDYEFKVYCKYTDYANVDYLIGTDEERVKLCAAKINIPEDPSTAVSDVNAAKTVASVKYMNAAGMVSDTAFQGVNIVVTKYADGTQSTAKVVK